MADLTTKTKRELWEMLKFQQSLYEKGLTTWEKAEEIRKVFDSIK
jgi:hypothetical protein